MLYNLQFFPYQWCVVDVCNVLWFEVHRVQLCYITYNFSPTSGV